MSDSVGSVSVDVVPDARGWSEKLRAQIRDQTVKIQADADTAEAETQLDEVARDRVAKVRVEPEGSYIDEGGRLRDVKTGRFVGGGGSDSSGGAFGSKGKSPFTRGANALDKFIGKLGLLPALAITAGAALVPLGAAIGGVVAALAAPLAIAGGGATLFALLGGAAVKKTQDQLKSISDLQKKLAGLKKGTQEYADVQKQLRAQQDALSPAQERFAASLDGLKSAFATLLGGKTGQALLGPFSQGMDLLSKLLPIVAPLLQSVSSAFSDLLGDLSKGADSPGFGRFVDQIARLAGRDIRIGGHILGDLAKGFGSLLATTDKGFSGGFLKGIEHLTQSFSDWASSKEGRRDVRHFFDYVHDVGPQVADTVGAIARGVGHFVKALAPLGPPVLRIIEGIADAFNSMPVPVLTALAGAAAGLVAFQKVGGFKATSLLTKGLGGSGVAGGLLSGGVQKVFVVNMGAGGLGGGPGGGALGASRSLPIIGAAVAAGVYSKNFADNERDQNVAQYGTNNLVDIAAIKLRRAQAEAGYHAPATRSIKVGDFNLALPVASKSLTSSTSGFDALRAHAQQASRQIDMIGPHANAAFAAASKDVAAFNDKLNSIHDKKFAIIAQTQSAVSSLERLQAFRIRDKSFTVYQRSQLIEQAVGPGGGRGRSNPGGGSGGGAGRAAVHVHLDDSGRATLSGYMQGHAQDVYDQNRAFEAAHQ